MNSYDCDLSFFHNPIIVCVGLSNESARHSRQPPQIELTQIVALYTQPQPQLRLKNNNIKKKKLDWNTKRDYADIYYSAC